MPTFDGGHYFLTVLVPIRTTPVEDGHTRDVAGPCVAQALDVLPTAAQIARTRNGQSPFAKNKRTILRASSSSTTSPTTARVGQYAETAARNYIARESDGRPSRRII